MTTVTELVLAMTSFVGTHLIMSHPLRAPLVSRLGDRGFLGLYSLISFATLGWVIYAVMTLPPQAPAWVAGRAVWHGLAVVMLLAAILLVGSLIGNPAMVDPTGSPRFPQNARGVMAITRHPMMWSFILWASVHAGVWGSPSNLILSAGIGGLALIGALGQDAKKRRMLGQPWREWESKTSFVPFAALISGRASWRAAIPGMVPLIGGLLVWLGATWLHPALGGPPVGPWLWTG
ncbi:NnrU family protein [Sphingobium nicotianae]|uniref:MFS transporter n=1 Tax=Sphingobium nicotianae TaxID=2782607 RepID=A0A9X1DFF2_9SPHN|nr:NnrU family protein [Sphingobium nicotianae]MBT2188508.1 MFS transporter [Sphingobium nicotianae]